MIEEVSPDLLLSDFGLSITAGAVSGLCILDENSEIILGGQVVMVDYTATCRTDMFGGLQYGSGVSVDGKGYTVRHEGLRLGDGAFCVIPLERLEIQNGTVPPAVIGGPAADIPETVVVPEPVIGDDWPIWMTKTSVTLTSVRAVVSGTDSPSAAIELVYDASALALGTAAIEPLVVDNETTGEVAVILNQPIPPDQQVRVKVTGVTGTVKHVTIYLRGITS